MRLLFALAVLSTAVSTLAGQTNSDGTVALFAARIDSARGATLPRSLPFRSATAQKFAPVASAIVPGSGQYMLGDDRSIGYLAVEALAWLQYRKNVREQAAQETEFKALARRVARASFASGSPDQLPDGDWAYYEKLIDFNESGAFSLAVGGPVTPETDVTTYNGSRWQLAQATFPTRQGALAEYMRTAIRPEYQWSWRNAKLQRDLFVRTTGKRNDAYRAGLANLMVIGANHAISMIDAFTTFRLRASSDRGGATSIGASISW